MMIKRKPWEELTDEEKAFAKENIKKLLESMDKMKETQRIQYDYFKHLTTLSTGSILIIVAFLEKVFSFPSLIGLSMASVTSLAFCLVGSLLAMPSPGNVIMYISGMEMMYHSGDENAVWNLNEKLSGSMDTISCFDKITKTTFLLGIGLFLAFAFFNFLK